MTTTALLDTDAALAELHLHLAAIERLQRAPFNAERIAVHRDYARECLDVIANAIDA